MRGTIDSDVGGPTQAWELLYDCVALSMWTYIRTAFRFRYLGPRFPLEPGLVLVSTHRAETDVPLICGGLYFPTGSYDRRRPRLHFTPRDDMYERGFFAGFPPDLPIRARRLLWPLAIGPFLPRVRCYPIPFPGAKVMRLARALESIPPDSDLDAVLPPTIVAELRERSVEAGLDRPQTSSQVLRGEYADLLWKHYTPEDLAAPEFAEGWQRRIEGARRDIERITGLLRDGRPFLFFPEGRPTPDGSIGPLRPGLRILVRFGRVQRLRMISLAYDPLTRGRPFAYLSIGKQLDEPFSNLDELVLESLRHAVPLTLGQVVSHELAAAALDGRTSLTTRVLDEAVAAAVDRSRAETRNIDTDLEDESSRQSRLSDCLLKLLQLELVIRADRRTVAFDPQRILESDSIRRLAVEYGAAREDEQAETSVT